MFIHIGKIELKIYNKKGTTMQILGFIPARGGSKGIPGKNIHPIAGKPLIAYTIEQALKSRINKTIVSTDSQDVAAVAKQYGAEVPFLRPNEFSGDESIIEEAIFYTLDNLLETENYIPDVIVLLQPTSPLRTSRHIDDTIELILSKNADTIVSVSEPMEHPCEMVYWDENNQFRFFFEAMLESGIQRQGYPQCYFINGAIYAFTFQSFSRNKNRMGERKKIFPYFMKQRDSIDIDSVDDLYIAESVIMRGQNGNNT
jgi:CMP-N,N'-diacetyllegionaminic acid synthase